MKNSTGRLEGKVAIITGMSGIPRGKIEELKQLLEMLGQSFSLNREIFPEINAAFDSLWVFRESLVCERRTPGGTPCSAGVCLSAWGSFWPACRWLRGCT